jgi:hypothetical protein
MVVAFWDGGAEREKKISPGPSFPKRGIGKLAAS